MDLKRNIEFIKEEVSTNSMPRVVLETVKYLQKEIKSFESDLDRHGQICMKVGIEKGKRIAAQECLEIFNDYFNKAGYKAGANCKCDMSEPNTPSPLDILTADARILAEAVLEAHNRKIKVNVRELQSEYYLKNCICPACETARRIMGE